MKRTALNLALKSTLVLLLFFFAGVSAQYKTYFTESTPEEQGISSTAILTFIEQSEKEIDAMHSFMILRHGNLISAGWWEPFDPETPHIMHSLSKSFTSSAVGLAIEEGLISLDDQVISFFPGETPENPSSNLKSMRIRDLITMNTGHIKEPRSASIEDNWVKAFLNAEVELKPGTHFKYNSMATYMLSAIIQKVSGEKLVDYLNSRLFEPLEIEYPRWDTCPQGINTGGWGLYITTEDIAKLGQLYLQKGRWDEKQILSEEWVEMATSKQVSNGSNPHSDWEQGYGFQFWMSRHNAYRGDGAYGQFCLVLPEKDVVIAITSASSNMGRVMQLVWDILLPAMKDEPLPGNMTALKALEEKTGSLKIRMPEGEQRMPLVRSLSGSRFLIDDRETGVKAISFDFRKGRESLFIEMDHGKERITIGSNIEEKLLKNHLPYTEGIPGPVVSGGAWISPDTYRIRIYFKVDI
ncbi:MAG: serine hydrolase domain-containing protein [Bacteroidota bacterium]